MSSSEELCEGIKPCVRNLKGNVQDPTTPGFYFAIFFPICLITVISLIIILIKKFNRRRRSTPTDGETDNDELYYAGFDSSRNVSKYTRYIMIWRFLAFSHCFLIVCNLFSTLSQPRGWKNFCFFTVWNWILICLYFSVAFLTSVCDIHYNYCTRLRRILYYALYYIGEIEIPYSILVTFITWTVLAPASNWDKRLGWFEFPQFSMHVFNMVYMMADFLFCAPYTINPRHVNLPLCWGVAYGYFHLVLNAKTGTIMYPYISETDDLLVIPANIGQVTVVIISFYILYWIGLCKKRKSFCRCCFFAYDKTNEEEGGEDNGDNIKNHGNDSVEEATLRKERDERKSKELSDNDNSKNDKNRNQSESDDSKWLSPSSPILKMATVTISNDAIDTMI